MNIEDALRPITLCPGVEGVVIASAEGLLLAAHGQLQGDEAAACAAQLTIETQTTMAILGHERPMEAMLWTDTHVWYQTRTPSNHSVLAVSASHAHAGALRMAVRSALPAIQDAMDQLHTDPATHGD
ncbi:MAG TPA: roadblock/LC7 domain-containing protein [Burkholderiaceae bacterium]|nr:roadblock/LC7 domain-containing protein [Burkholderiaceae bacterium]